MSREYDSFDNIDLNDNNECPVCLDNKEILTIVCHNKHKICNDCWRILLFLNEKLCPICREKLRELKEPTAVEKYGKTFYYLEDMLHRKDLPAVIGNGVEEYYFLGLRHRVKEPAVISPTRKEWWSFGKRHNASGLAVIEFINYRGVVKVIRREWWFNGVRHRLGAPAVISGDIKEWWEYGKLIRTKKSKCHIM